MANFVGDLLRQSALNRQHAGIPSPADDLFARRRAMLAAEPREDEFKEFQRDIGNLAEAQIERFGQERKEQEDASIRRLDQEIGRNVQLLQHDQEDLRRRLDRLDQEDLEADERIVELNRSLVQHAGHLSALEKQKISTAIQIEEKAKEIREHKRKELRAALVIAAACVVVTAGASLAMEAGAGGAAAAVPAKGGAMLTLALPFG